MVIRKCCVSGMDVEVEMVKANDVLGVDVWHRYERDCSHFIIKILLCSLTIQVDTWLYLFFKRPSPMRWLLVNVDKWTFIVHSLVWNAKWAYRTFNRGRNMLCLSWSPDLLADSHPRQHYNLLVGHWLSDFTCHWDLWRLPIIIRVNQNDGELSSKDLPEDRHQTAIGCQQLDVLSRLMPLFSCCLRLFLETGSLRGQAGFELMIFLFALSQCWDRYWDAPCCLSL